MGMVEFELMRKSLEKALALVHAAIDDRAGYPRWDARRYALEVLASVGRIKRAALTMHDAHLFLMLVGQLRAVLAVLDATREPSLVLN
jgi:hypothetical protein